MDITKNKLPQSFSFPIPRNAADCSIWSGEVEEPRMMGWSRRNCYVAPLMCVLLCDGPDASYASEAIPIVESSLVNVAQEDNKQVLEIRPLPNVDSERVYRLRMQSKSDCSYLLNVLMTERHSTLKTQAHSQAKKLQTMRQAAEEHAKQLAELQSKVEHQDQVIKALRRTLEEHQQMTTAATGVLRAIRKELSGADAKLRAEITEPLSESGQLTLSDILRATDVHIPPLSASSRAAELSLPDGSAILDVFDELRHGATAGACEDAIGEAYVQLRRVCTAVGGVSTEMKQLRESAMHKTNERDQAKKQIQVIARALEHTKKQLDRLKAERIVPMTAQDVNTAGSGAVTVTRNRSNSQADVRRQLSSADVSIIFGAGPSEPARRPSARDWFTASMRPGRRPSVTATGGQAQFGLQVLQVQGLPSRRLSAEGDYYLELQLGDSVMRSADFRVSRRGGSFGAAINTMLGTVLTPDLQQAALMQTDVRSEIRLMERHKMLKNKELYRRSLTWGELWANPNQPFVCWLPLELAGLEPQETQAMLRVLDDAAARDIMTDPSPPRDPSQFLQIAPIHDIPAPPSLSTVPTIYFRAVFMPPSSEATPPLGPVEDLQLLQQLPDTTPLPPPAPATPAFVRQRSRSLTELLPSRAPAPALTPSHEHKLDHKAKVHKLKRACKALLTENQALRDRLQALESAAP